MVVANRVRDSSGKLYAYCKWHKLVADSLPDGKGRPYPQGHAQI